MECNLCLGKFTNACLISQRLLLTIMLAFATFTSYTMRVALSMGITEMVHKSNKTINIEGETCPEIEHKSAVHDSDTIYEWDEHEQGLILGSFYWGYIITHLPCAQLAEKVGGKHVLNVGMLSNAVLTILLPLIIKMTNGDVIVVVIVRVVMGLGQGMLYPVLTTILAQWAPPKEKGFLSSVAYSGANLGTVVGNALSGILIQATGDWSIIFYFFGLLTLLWCIWWQLVCYSFPRTHPCLKEKERQYLEEQLNKDVSKASVKTPWKSMLLSIPVWAFIITQIGHDWGWYIMVTDLPKYFSAVLRFEVSENGLWSSLPYLLMWLTSLIAGLLCDFLIDRHLLSVRWARLIFGTLGQAGPGVFIILASYVGCARIPAVLMFTMAMLLMGFYFCGVKVNALDLAPNFAGTLTALANGLGVITGMVVPSVVGLIAQNQTKGEWRIVFWLTFGILVGTNLIYVIFMSASVQPWNQAKQEENKQ